MASLLCNGSRFACILDGVRKVWPRNSFCGKCGQKCNREPALAASWPVRWTARTASMLVPWRHSSEKHAASSLLREAPFFKRAFLFFWHRNKRSKQRDLHSASVRREAGSFTHCVRLALGGRLIDMCALGFVSHMCRVWAGFVHPSLPLREEM